MVKIQQTTKSKRFKFDATGQSVGRLATQIAVILMGKNDPDYNPSIDNTNRVIVENVDKVKFTGKKLEQKQYYHHSLYPGGLKKTSLKKLSAENPEKVLMKAVRLMLPKNKLSTPRLKRILFK